MKIQQQAIVLAIGLIECFANDLKAQDTLVLNTGKAYVATVTDVRDSYIKYKRYPAGDEPSEILDIQALKEIRFADGNRMTFGRIQNHEPKNVENRESNMAKNTKDVGMYVTDFSMKPPSYYLQQSANCQYGAIGTAAAAGLFALLGSKEASSGFTSDNGALEFQYVVSIAFGVAAIVLELASI